MIKLDLLKDGKKFAVTFSYDDGQVFDERLIGILNEHNLKGTFHLNSTRLGDRIKDIAKIYAGHEISCHGCEHATLNFLPPQNIHHEIFEDRLSLEHYALYPVTGLSYANGAYSDSIISNLKSCGIVYSRTTQSTKGFGFPDDFMEWHPTCHHNDSLELADKFLGLFDGYLSGPKLFYVWGHSYEFDRHDNWDLIEKLADKISGKDNVWYATNIEIYRYAAAARNLVISADNTIVYNPSAETVWFSNNNKPYKIEGGQTLYLEEK